MSALCMFLTRPSKCRIRKFYVMLASYFYEVYYTKKKKKDRDGYLRHREMLLLRETGDSIRVPQHHNSFRGKVLVVTDIPYT